MPRKPALLVVAPRDGRRRGAERAQAGGDARPVRAGGQADRDRRLRARGSAAQQRRVAHVGHPALVLERPHDADHAQPDLVAAAGLHRERRAGPQPERVGEPEPDLGLVGRAQPPPGRQRRRLEARVVAGVADQPHRLAEPEGVGARQLVARRGGAHAGQPPHRRQPRGSRCAVSS